MSDTDQITLYSCHLCGFCETTLSALTKHTASHIKAEGTSERVTSSKDNNNRSASSSPEVIFANAQPRNEGQMNTRQHPNEDEDRNRDRRPFDIGDEGVHDGNDMVSKDQFPQIGDDFPTTSYPVTTQSRVIFPSGWSEPVQRSMTLRLPIDPKQTTQRTNTSFSSQQQHETSDRRHSDIVSYTTDRLSNSQGQLRGIGMTAVEERHTASLSTRIEASSNNTVSSMQNDSFLSSSHDDMNHDIRTSDSGIPLRSNSSNRNSNRHLNFTSRSSPSSSAFVQYAFNRFAAVGRPNDSAMLQRRDDAAQYQSEVQVRSSPGESNRHYVSSYHQPAFPAPASTYDSLDNASYSQRGNKFLYQHDSGSDHHGTVPYRYQQEGNRGGLQVRRQQSLSPDGYLMPRSNANCVIQPIPLPNNGTYVPRHSDTVVVPHSLCQSNVSGFVVIPIKKTSEVSVQTDESCLSMEYLQYQAPLRSVTSTASLQAGSEARGIGFGEQQQRRHARGYAADVVRRSSAVKCHVCAKEFPDGDRLKVHFDRLHGTESFHCKDCARVFDSEKSLQFHRARIHSKRMPFRCGVCNLRFEDRSSVVQHLTTHNAKEKTFDCDTCGKKFRSEEKLKKHMLKHNDMWHKCVECHKSFGSIATLQYHVVQVHKRQSQIEDGYGNHQAEMVMPAGEYPAYSEIGNRAVEANRSFQRMSAEQSVDQPLFTCRYCQATFNDESDLGRHSQECSLAPTERNSSTSSSSKMFRCAACPTLVQTKPELVDHYNSHHLTRDGYVCTKCPRKFRLWSKLKAHIKNFHGLKKTSLLKFMCKACPNRFSSRLKLDDHMKKVHQIPVKHERIYTCKECKKRFRNLSSLMVHRRGVHALNILESPSTQTWECPHCNIDRLTRKTYIAHLKEVHNLLVAEKGRSLEIIGKGTNNPKEGTVDQRSKDSAADDEVDQPATPELGEQQKIYCQECGADFYEEKRLKNHLGLVHGKQPFKCNVCDQMFSYSGQLVWHLNKHDENAGLVGEEQKSEAPSDMDSSAMNEQPSYDDSASVVRMEDGKERATKGGNQVKLLSCKHCAMVFSNEKRLYNHLGAKHGCKSFVCNICDERFSYSTHLIWHKRNHFGDKGPAVPIDEEEEENIIIDRTNKRAGKEKDDVGTVIGKCDLCAREFGDEDSLQAHQKTCECEPRVEELPTEVDENEKRSREANSAENNTACSPGYATSEDQADAIDHHEKFDEKDGLNDHMTRAHDAADNMEQSRMNASNSDEISMLPAHEKDNQLPPHTGFNCEVCNKLLSTYIGWKVHRTRVHRLSDDKTEAQAAAFSYALQNYPAATMPPPPTMQASAMPMPADYDADVYVNQRELGSEDINSSAVFSCSKCSRIFTGLRNLRTHQFKMHSIRMKEKQPTDASEQFQGNSETHVMSDGQEIGVFKCGTCDYRFTSEKGRRIHCKKMMHLEHRSSSDSDRGGILEGANATVDGSDADLPMTKKAKLSKDFDPVVSPCEICGIEFGSFEALRQHFQKKHPEEISFQSPSKDSSWSQESDAGFELESGVRSQDSAQRTFPCPKCDRTFSTRKGLNTHFVKFHKIKGAAFVKWMRKTGYGNPKPQDEAYAETGSGYTPTVSSGLLSANGTENERRSGGMSSHFMPTMVGSLSNDQMDQTVSTARRVCSICQRSFQNRRGLTMHMARFHHLNKAELRKFNIDLDLMAESEMLAAAEGIDGEKSVAAVDKASKFTELCPLCPLKFPSRRSLGTHIFKRHGIRCKRLSPAERRSLFNMNKSATSTDSDQFTTSATNEGLVAIDCPICTGKFVGKRGVRAHVSRIHSLDKIELGFLFPEKYQTEDNVTKTCTQCNRVFNNIRIYAAHLYFVHKLEKDDSLSSGNDEGAHEDAYRCGDIKCDKAFGNALDLLIHVREKNGRGANSNGGEDRGMISAKLLACFICKSEFENEVSFRIHYETAHGGLSPEDAEKLRDMIERNRLQTEAVSKEYSLRDTASRKAIRSEFEYTENYLNSPSQTRENSVAYQDKLQADDEYDYDYDDEVIAIEPRPDVGHEDSDHQGEAFENQSEASRKNFFAAALNLRVTP
eukprot:gene18221-20039_t